MTFNYLSLFSGIGGLDLGLDRADMTCVGQVEREPYCQRVLAKHWPEVSRHDDVRTAPDWWLGTTRPRVDLVAGGFPCQPFSTVGSKRGLADERWGWPWFWDVVRVVRPEYILVENVSALLTDRDAMGIIFADLASGGYDADWDCIPAAAIGAPHLRDRVFLVAHTISDGLRKQPVTVHRRSGTTVAEHDGPHGHVAHTNGPPGAPSRRAGRPVFGPAALERLGRCRSSLGQQWAAEPGMGRTLDGFSSWLDRSGRLEESHKLVSAYANAAQRDPAEALRELRDTHGTCDDGWSPGRRGSLPAQTVLLAYLRQLQERGRQAGPALASPEAPEAGVRVVRVDEVPARPPLRREPVEQRPGKSPDSLHALSQLLARAAEQAWSAYRRTDAGATGWGWEDGYVRVATGVPARMDRLRGLGNAVVPQVAEHVGCLILDHAAVGAP